MNYLIITSDGNPPKFSIRTFQTKRDAEDYRTACMQYLKVSDITTQPASVSAKFLKQLCEALNGMYRHDP